MSGRRAIVLNGPNLNLLGEREPHLYGNVTLSALEISASAVAKGLGWKLTWVQSNHEGVLIDEIQGARTSFDGIVINAGGFTHTSVAIRDALSATRVPIVEVHITNIHAREEFRHRSFISPIASAVIIGAGPLGYELAIRYLHGTSSDGVAL